MGLYDREYSREPEQGFQLTAPQSATMQLLVVTIGVFILQVLVAGVTNFLALRADWYLRPWEIYGLLTYGFAHATDHTEHILFNMLVLGMFGRMVEDRYGWLRFLTFYLSAIVVGGLAWTLAEAVASQGPPGAQGTLIGASAATTAVFLLFALNFPRQGVRLMFVLPMPAWVVALLGVTMDLIGALSRSGNVAFTAHLGGALAAWVFYRYGWLPGDGIARWIASRPLRSRPKLRVHEPDEADDADHDLARQVDLILQKIQEQGQESLTRSERRLLERASRQYQQKRR